MISWQLTAIAGSMPRKSAKSSYGPSKRRSAGKPGNDVANSRERLLRAASLEFASQGLLGARVDAIARRAKINKQLIYYHFGDKDSLYLAVLEQAYSEIRRKEHDLNLSGKDPIEAMRKLIGFTFDYVAEHREFVRLLINENILEARFVRRSRLIRQTSSPIVDLLQDTLQRGSFAGVFRPDVDPVQLYISMAALCFFYIGNIHTLSAVFERDLNRSDLLRERRKHVTEFVLGYLRPEEKVSARATRTVRNGARPARAMSA
jgi:TetR/AcrR family transcriptional regulator